MCYDVFATLSMIDRLLYASLLCFVMFGCLLYVVAVQFRTGICKAIHQAAPKMQTCEVTAFEAAVKREAQVIASSQASGRHSSCLDSGVWPHQPHVASADLPA